MTLHLSHLEWCPYPSGKLKGVCGLDPLQFWPPCWCFYPVDAPKDPLIAIFKGQLWCWGLIRIIVIASIGHPLPRQKLLHLQIKLGWAPQILRPGLWPVRLVTLSHFVCTLPTGVVGRAWAVGPFSHKIVTPWHMPGFSGVASCSSPDCQILQC